VKARDARVGRTGDDRPAIDGGTPVRAAPFPPRRLLGPEEKAAAAAVFDEAIESGEAFGYGGPRERAYEREFAESLGGGFAKAVNSGTSAVLAALAALEPACGSEVVVPPISDPGGVMPVAMLNCVPVPADADGRGFNAGPEQVAAAVTERTRAIVVAHIMGEPADMAGIGEVARARGLPVVEDAAQAHGATLDGRPVGTFGDIAAFSTMSGKHYATGAQGGMVFTRDESLYWKARRFMDRGKPFGPPSGPLAVGETSNVRLGLNLNSDELAAAIGRVQLARLPEIVRRRREVAAGVAAGIAGLGAVAPGELVAGAEASYWRLRLRVRAEALRVDKDGFAAAVAAEGIPVMASYRHLPSEQAWFRERRTYGSGGCPWTCPHYAGPREASHALPNALAAVDACFLLAIHERWTEREVADAAAALAKVERAYRTG